MKVFICSCKWKWVIGKKKVFGPIFEDGDGRCARMHPFEDWKDGYGDCWSNLERIHG